jgi:hypothetical protein
MNTYVPKTPNARNTAIFEAVEAGRSQAEVAKEHGLSQPQVSRICRRVVQWLVRHRMIKGLQHAPDSVWLAHRRGLAELKQTQADIKAAFTKTCQPREETIQTFNEEGKLIGETRKTKPPQPSAALATSLVKTTKEILVAETAEIAAFEKLRDLHTKDRLCVEEYHVTQGVQAMEELVAIAKQMERQGYAAPSLPRMSRRELADEIRKSLREKFEKGESAKWWQCLPSAWQSLDRFVRGRESLERAQVYPTASSADLSAVGDAAALAAKPVAASTSDAASSSADRRNLPQTPGIKPPGFGGSAVVNARQLPSSTTINPR